MTNLSVASEDHEYYGDADVYWGTFPSAKAAINCRLSGSPDGDWIARFRDLTKSRRFERALILNCGDGRFERKLAAAGVISDAVGVDASSDLLDRARRGAADDGLRFTYRQMDVNSTAFADEQIDLVVNHAAAHHVRYIDRVLRACCRMLPDDGWLVSYDYVGLHRNQYPWEMWEAACRLNDDLPEQVRNTMEYPHLPTMLAVDPTEAVHSELFVETVGRYFDVVETRDSGGALAYLVLTHNRGLFDLAEPERTRWVDHVMGADAAWLDQHPGSTLFSYLAARPDHERLADEQRLRAWSAEEDDREARAETSGGEYYDRTPLQRLTLDLSDARLAAEHRLATIHDLQARYDADITQLRNERDQLDQRLAVLAGRFPNRQLSRLAAIARRVRRGTE